MRLFVSVPLPSAQREHLRRAVVGQPADPDRWHLTLAFLGERDDVGGLVDALTGVGAQHGPFDLRLAGGGTFPGVVWAGVAGELEALSSLASAVAQACGLPASRHHPHVTVARRGRALPPVGYEGPAWRVEAFDLVHSVLGRPVEHRVLDTFALGSPRPPLRYADARP